MAISSSQDKSAASAKVRLVLTLSGVLENVMKKKERKYIYMYIYESMNSMLIPYVITI